ncbi:hypothetical protein BCR33DRAFT_745816 [Rhizoclosmatium globosum]|uniref:BZIP domain-containing protein n=1 Tax=Rhizoclosmatium globosum TaxID=329046 RepID=A0A1Y2B0V5_9FUNG|nr:hypothetical protein BCR33DRAFT_745816 [Rhizoclosmatium globosum]|eukprot:ORY28117.1 hypothetical protein BCR33DRAFT_745816 [Rhizoclosmatium globosum]
MDSDSDAPVTPTGLDKPYNPHSNRGRKRTDAEAPSKRSGQMREAQRAHRERKKMYLLDLEAKAKELDLVKAKLELAELKLASLGSSPSPSSHSICSNPSCAQRITHLENMVSQLQYEAQSWSLLQNPSNHYQQQNQQLPLHLPPNQITLLDDLLNNNSMIASEILFGPVDVTPFHNLKSLDSLKDTHVPDTLVELTLAHTKITQTSQLKLMFFKIIQALNDMFDNCSILDRVKAAEFVAIFLERNPNHFVELF